MFQIKQSIDDIVSIDPVEHKRDCLKILVALMILYEEDYMLAVFMTMRICEAKGLYYQIGNQGSTKYFSSAPYTGSDKAIKRSIHWGAHHMIVNISHTIKMTWLVWIKRLK